MKYKIFISTVALSFVLGGCGNNTPEVSTVPDPVEQATSTEIEDKTTEIIVEDTTETIQTEEEQEETSDTIQEFGDTLSTLGQVEVDKGLFNVEITLPSDYVGDVTQDELNEKASEKGFKSATLNADSSVTYVMTKEQHQELLATTKENINSALQDMIGSENYPNITNITANDNFTDFKVSISTEELSINEGLSVMAFYTYGGMYGIYNGEKPDNIHVDFINANSGNVIKSADSKNLGQ